MREAPRERQLALIRAHPELAGREARAGELTAASAGEQASAGLDRLTAEELERWRALNRAYRERFGFPLVVCVREHTKASILRWGEERLGTRAERGDRDRAGRDREDRRALRLSRSSTQSITTHVLDTARGLPAAGRAGRPRARDRRRLASCSGSGTTDADGRAARARRRRQRLAGGRYRLTFDTGAYFRGPARRPSIPEVAVVFTVAGEEHHHVPLLLSPFGYSTYRGS